MRFEKIIDTVKLFELFMLAKEKSDKGNEE